MKNIFTTATLVLLLQFTVNAQSGIISNAIFAECKDAEKRGKCGNEKVEREISQLLTKEITADLKKTLSTNYISVSLAFLSDAEGRVMPETLKIKCDNKLFYDALHNYITRLPLFLPKDKSLEERRSVHMYDYTFIYDDNLGKYISASNEKIKAENIKEDVLPFGAIPVCQGCEDKDRETAFRCTSAKLNKIISTKYRTEKLGDFQGKIKLLATFIVEKDGSVQLTEITSEPHSDIAIKELDYLISTLPNFVPGNYMGIPVSTSYALPVTLNFEL